MRKRLRKILLVVLAVPVIPWLYFRLVHYPVELERHTRGSYAVVAFAEPTDFWRHPAAIVFEIGVVFGSIHNYTQVRVELRKDGRRLDSAILAQGEDLPEDHVPLRVTWSETAVTVAERKNHRSATFPLQRDKKSSRAPESPPRPLAICADACGSGANCARAGG